ncbi:MAG TPA: alpha/beta hydrolase [Paraburkholderia sp.]|jgi:pimeloyl-ACP methyl ester carboxylesterase|uniref:serine aminopeptidase domain-containing protein n=1 Tax=Paraburkholderia sp. TaxID=1926495 RepID=UPI002DEEBB9D|nr:alpha/beta hydrolase [Paraburkholderia sp.]
MDPVVFEGAFGWLHPADGRTGVVLCNPFGYDALCTHRGWRKLAERLAAAGLPVLRFDYPGTGDAAGNEDDPCRVETWLGSIDAAVRHLREWTGVTRVALVGLRLGATLAAIAAQRIGDIDDLVLLAPPVTGRRYIRELRAHRQSWLSTSAGVSAASLADDGAYVEAFGFGLHGDDIATLSALDLMRANAAPAQRALLLDSSGANQAALLAAHYASLGVQVEEGGFEESDRFFLEALYSTEPRNAFDRVSAWLASGLERAPATTSRAPLAAQPVLRLERHQATERPVRFGHCFGIHCEPDVPRSGAPAVLLINTGAAHHIGDGRIAVLLARRMAQQGIASLRMDVGGLGDAQPGALEVTLDVLYSTALRDDAASGADWLVARGHARIATFGVCGGAFVGLHASALHPNIVAAYGVNLQKFTWDGAARSPGEQRMVSSKTYLHALFSADKWKRALRGQTDASPLRIAFVLAKRIARRAARICAQGVAGRMGWTVAANEACVLLQRIDTKKVQLRLIYGEYDSGLEEARLQLGTSFAALKTLSCVRALTLPSLDHSLFAREARESVMADFEAWLDEAVCCATSVSTTATASAEDLVGSQTAPLAGGPGVVHLGAPARS